MSTPCARCPKALGASCCEVRPHEQLATLTHGDVDRIAQHTGWPSRRFVETEWFDAVEARAWEELHLLYRGYFAVATRRLTLARADGACVFFEKGHGCSLPADVRPTACRLYPFEPRAGGSWSLQVERHGSVERARDAHESAGTGCLAVEEADSFESLAAAFGTTLEEIESIAQQLRAEVAQHARRERSDESRQR